METNLIIYEKPTELLDKFLDLYNNLYPIDRDKSIKYIKSGQNIPLEKRWYEALDNDTIDYSVYDDDYYFTDIYTCWKNYSRKYLKDFTKQGMLPEYAKEVTLIDLFSANINSIADLGCGLGYTSASLKQLFPELEIYATNIEDTKQYKFCQLLEDEYGFILKNSIEDINKNIDLVVASEYFEHMENPVEHLEDILRVLNPKYIIIANSFNTNAIGHFYNYTYKNQIVPAKEMSKIFNSEMYNKGYIKLKTKFWNNRPTIWVKENKSTNFLQKIK